MMNICEHDWSSPLSDGYVQCNLCGVDAREADGRPRLIVIDPDDPEVIDRVARAINSMVDQYGERWQARERARARAVISALKGTS